MPSAFAARMLLVVCMTTVQLVATPVFQVTDMGAINGSVTGINSNGQVSGWSVDPSGVAFALVGSGSWSVLGDYAQAFGLNDNGQVAGVMFDGATLWSGGTATSLAGPGSYARAINNSGQVTGSVSGQAVRFQGGGTTVLGAPGMWSAGYAINNAGMIAGTAQITPGSFAAFLWSPGGGSLILPTLGGASSYSHAINDWGVVAGNSTTAGGYLRGFVYRDGVMTDLGTLGGAHSGAYGINSDGEIVGYSLTGSGDSAAFLWAGGILLDLNETIDPALGWLLEEAMAINELGQIAGTGIYQGARHGFLLTPSDSSGTHRASPFVLSPVPEPSSGVLLLAGLAILVIVRSALQADG